MRSKPEETHFGRRIAAARARRGHSQATVARRAGIDPSYLSRLETGRVQPTVRMALRIAGALRMPLEDLLGSTPPEKRGLPCPVSRSGRCLMDLLDTGTHPEAGPEAFSQRQLRLLRQFAAVLQESDLSVQRALEVLLDQIRRES